MTLAGIQPSAERLAFIEASQRTFSFGMCYNPNTSAVDYFFIYIYINFIHFKIILLF